MTDPTPQCVNVVGACTEDGRAAAAAACDHLRSRVIHADDPIRQQAAENPPFAEALEAAHYETFRLPDPLVCLALHNALLGAFARDSRVVVVGFPRNAVQAESWASLRQQVPPVRLVTIEVHSGPGRLAYHPAARRAQDTPHGCASPARFNEQVAMLRTVLARRSVQRLRCDAPHRVPQILQTAGWGHAAPAGHPVPATT